MNEPRFRREGGTRDMVLPGNKKFVEGGHASAFRVKARDERAPRVKATAKMRSVRSEPR
jgi:hypothetical protein